MKGKDKANSSKSARQKRLGWWILLALVLATGLVLLGLWLGGIIGSKNKCDPEARKKCPTGEELEQDPMLDCGYALCPCEEEHGSDLETTCWDGVTKLVRDPDQGCEYDYDLCPQAPECYERYPDSYTQTCGDGSIITRDPDLDCEFPHECPPELEETVTFKPEVVELRRDTKLWPFEFAGAPGETIHIVTGDTLRLTKAGHYRLHMPITNLDPLVACDPELTSIQSTFDPPSQVTNRPFEKFTFQTSQWPDCPAITLAPDNLFDFHAAGSVNLDMKVQGPKDEEWGVIVSYRKPGNTTQWTDIYRDIQTTSDGIRSVYLTFPVVAGSYIAIKSELPIDAIGTFTLLTPLVMKYISTHSGRGLVTNKVLLDGEEVASQDIPLHATDVELVYSLADVEENALLQLEIENTDNVDGQWIDLETSGVTLEYWGTGDPGPD